MYLITLGNNCIASNITSTVKNFKATNLSAHILCKTHTTIQALLDKPTKDYQTIFRLFLTGLLHKNFETRINTIVMLLLRIQKTQRVLQEFIQWKRSIFGLKINNQLRHDERTPTYICRDHTKSECDNFCKLPTNKTSNTSSKTNNSRG